MKIVVLVCIALTGIGAFLPWYGVSAEVMGQSISNSISGFQYFSYGIFVFFFSLATIILSFIEKAKKFRVFIMILALLFSIIPFFHHPEPMNYSSGFGSASSGFLWGFYFTVVFAIISVILLFINDYVIAKKTVDNSFAISAQQKMVSNPESAVISNQSKHNIAPQSKIVCTKCNTANPVNTKFCSNCGSALESQKPTEQNQECSNCKTQYPTNARFCPQCGTPAKKEIDLSDL